TDSARPDNSANSRQSMSADRGRFCGRMRWRPRGPVDDSRGLKDILRLVFGGLHVRLVEDEAGEPAEQRAENAVPFHKQPAVALPAAEAELHMAGVLSEVDQFRLQPQR